MEHCAQCNGEAEQHSVVAIMNVKDVIALEGKSGRKLDTLGFDPGNTWAALPMCTKCHQEPTLKAHYFMRKDQAVALRMADFKNLQMPGR